MYTSGTTGRPKGAILTHNNIMWNCLNVLVDLDLRSDEVTLVTAPMFHTAALNMTCLPTLLKGGHLVIEPRFDADAVLETIARMRVTLLFGVPTMFTALTQSPKWAKADLSSVRLLLCGGAPVPKSLITTYLERGLSFVQGYGMTETAPGALIVDPHLSAETVGAAGVAHFFTDVHLVRDDGSPAAPGETGEVVIAGPNVMRGYWGLPDATDAGVSRWRLVPLRRRRGCRRLRGHHHRRPRQGRVYLRRRERLSSRGGEGACAITRQLSRPQSSALPTRRGARWESPTSCSTADGSVTEDELRAHVRTRLAGYKLPRSWVFLDSLPHTASGKVQKSQLRAQLASHEHTADRGGTVTTTVASVAELTALTGKHLGYSAWREITQEQINAFADAADDHQWIHIDPERAAAGPFGTTIAHGFLTLSLLVPMWSEILHYDGVRLGVNYGLNKVRFPSPVPVGSRIRTGATLVSVETVADGSLQVVVDFVIEREGAEKPCCVAQGLYRFYV